MACIMELSPNEYPLIGILNNKIVIRIDIILFYILHINLLVCPQTKYNLISDKLKNNFVT